MELKFLILFFQIIVQALGVTDIIVSNVPKCTEMAQYYIENHNVSTPELAIIVSVCEGVMRPCASGLGGGFQATIFNGYCKKTLYLNSREFAPRDYNPNDSSLISSIGVPSVLKGYEYLYTMNMCGMSPVLPWKDLFTENIKLAKAENELILASTLKQIADEGPVSSLYQLEGNLHQMVVADLAEVSSAVKAKDILRYKVKTLTPFNHKCLNYRVATTRIPGSGSTFILGCKIVTAKINRLYNLTYEQRFLFMYHTLRYMYSIKPYLRSRHVNITEIFANSGLIAESILKNINRPWKRKSITQFGNFTIAIPSHHERDVGTMNMVMKRGKVGISLTATINWGCGAGFKSPRLGFYYNNQLKDFDASGTPNRPRPFQVPQSSICGTILYSKKNNPVFQIGGAGGNTIIGSIFNTFFNYFVNNMTLVDANAAGRCYPSYYSQDEELRCESSVPESVKNIFKDFGFTTSFSSGSGWVTALSTVRNEPEGAFDTRKGGKVYIRERDDFRFT